MESFWPLSFTYLAIYPPTMKLFLVGGAFLSTAVVPGIFIFLMVKNGAAGDLELTDRKERVVPYLIIITSIMVCIFYMYKMMIPVLVPLVADGGLRSIALFPVH